MGKRVEIGEIYRGKVLKATEAEAYISLPTGNIGTVKIKDMEPVRSILKPGIFVDTFIAGVSIFGRITLGISSSLQIDNELPSQLIDGYRFAFTLCPTCEAPNLPGNRKCRRCGGLFDGVRYEI